MAARIVAVVVAYRPEPEVLARLLAALATQVHTTLLLDNGGGEGLAGLSPGDSVRRFDMEGNVGVAAAQNAGFRLAAELGATHVLLLDHDSVPAPAMVARLLAASARRRAEGIPVAAVGAAYIDRLQQASSPFTRMGWFGFRRVRPAAIDGDVAVSFLISAGSLVSLEAFALVGQFDERLFIDYVDIEWCLRAASRGWRCFGVPTAQFAHCLGDRPLAWRAGGRPVRLFGRTIPERSPLRHYYLFRNGTWLLLHRHMPLRWKLGEVSRLFTCFGLFALLAEGRAGHWDAMTRGVADGARGRMGPAGWPKQPSSMPS